MIVQGNSIILPSLLWQNNNNNGDEIGDSQEKGNDDMSPKKRRRARINLGKDENGVAQYKWASGYSIRELAADIQRIEQEFALAPPQRYAVQKKIETNSPPPLEKNTFRKYAEKWYTLYKKPHVRSSTREMYENVLKTHLNPAFGDRQLDSIGGDELQEFILEYEGKSSSLIDKIMMTLRQVFSMAVDDEIISRNPVAKMKPPEGTQGERLPLSLEDADTLKKAAASHKDGLFPLLLLCTGLRRGEALGLRWEDITEDSITVCRAVVYQKNNLVSIGETKTNSAHRVVPLLPELASKLGERKRGYVFGGNSALPYTSFHRMWSKLQEDIDVLEGVTPHRLRHTYLMLMRRAGIDPATQQYLMGHADYETTANTYTHIDAVDIGEARGKMATLLPNLLIQAK